MRQSKLIQKTKRLFRCDTVRLVHFEHTPTMFVVLGWHGVSEGEWVDHRGEPLTLEYVKEKTVAHGDTIDELWADVRKYRRLCLLDKIKDPVKRGLAMLEALL